MNTDKNKDVDLPLDEGILEPEGEKNGLAGAALALHLLDRIEQLEVMIERRSLSEC